ncbi:unnamed protein product, partial [Laminaria digitata]
QRTACGSVLSRNVLKPQPYWLIYDWLGLMEPARIESCPSGQRRGSAAPGDDKVPSPGQESFHTSPVSTTWGRKRRSPGSIPPRTVVPTFPFRVVQHNNTLRVLIC